MKHSNGSREEPSSSRRIVDYCSIKRAGATLYASIYRMDLSQGTGNSTYHGTFSDPQLQAKVPISPDCVFDASLVPETCPGRFIDLKGLINKFLESHVTGHPFWADPLDVR